jgi:anionic cell wall polymer biosynthesis LytR-Cps2A-Psr (LCP) family protein
MDGHMALNYARSRMTTSDFDRSRRQQEVIVALWAKALTFDTLVRIPRLWKELRAIVDTDLTMPEAVRLAYIVHGSGVESARTKRLGAGTTVGWVTPSGAQVLLPNKGSIQDAVRDLLSAPD